MAGVNVIAGFHLKKTCGSRLIKMPTYFTLRRTIAVVTALGKFILVGKQAIWHVFYSTGKSFYPTVMCFQLKTFT